MTGQISAGQAAYEAYWQAAGNFQLLPGAHVPAWADLPEPLAAAWAAAAAAAVSVTSQALRPAVDGFRVTEYQGLV